MIEGLGEGGTVDWVSIIGVQQCVCNVVILIYFLSTSSSFSSSFSFINNLTISSFSFRAGGRSGICGARGGRAAVPTRGVVPPGYIRRGAPSGHKLLVVRQL